MGLFLLEERRWKNMAFKRKQPKVSARELVAELESLFLRDGTEMAERGFYHKALASLHGFGGSIDKNTEELARIKVVILELKNAI
jgi:hypothetical protein